MASLIIDDGLELFLDAGFQTTTYSSGRYGQSMTFDDSVTAFVAGDTNLGSPSNVQAVAFDATPVRTAQTAVMAGTLTTGQLNGVTIRRIAEHDTAFGSVNGSSNTLIGGVDGQGLAKTSDFSLTAEKSYTSASA